LVIPLLRFALLGISFDGIHGSLLHVYLAYVAQTISAHHEQML